MPGTIRVSVLEAVDLPELLTDGTIGKDVTAKVTLGPRLFKTQPGVVDGCRIESWNSDFAFPVVNLRDKLVISICDSEDHSVTQTAIEIPSIIQKGSRDEFVALNKGGRIHLRMSFVLTEEERKKIEIMRVAALKRREEAERLKKTVIIQPVTPEKELKKSLVSTVVIAEVDVSTTGDRKDLKEPANESLGDRKDSTILGDRKDSIILGDKKDSTTVGDKKDSTPKPPAPNPMFNYAKAIGMPPSAKKIAKKPSSAVSDNSTDEVKADGDVNSGVQTVRESAKDAGQVVSSETARLDASVDSPSSGAGAASLVTIGIDGTPQANFLPPGESENVKNEVKATSGDVKSVVQTGRESAENAEELGNTKLDGAGPIVIKSTDIVDIVDIVAQANPPPTEAEPGVQENSTNEVGEANKYDMDSEAQTVRESAENSEEAGSSGNSKLGSSVVDASPSSDHESASLMITSTDSASRENLQLSTRRSSSGPMTLKTVKARVKRTLSRVSSRRSSNRVSSSNSLSRTPPPVPAMRIKEASLQESSAKARLYNQDRPV